MPSVLLSELKAKDYDKYLISLFAPDTNFSAALFLFHHEIYETLSAEEVMVAKIKLQWWRDVINEIIDGKPPRPHPVLLVLKDKTPNYTAMLRIIDSYDDLLDGKQPRSFEELTMFLQNTICKIFELTTIGNMSSPPTSGDLKIPVFTEMTTLAYAYTFIARKIFLNSSSSKSFSFAPENLVSSLVAKAELSLREGTADAAIQSGLLRASPHNDVIVRITKHYITRLKKSKNPESQKWLLALKLMF